MPPSARLLFCPAGPAAAAAWRDYICSVQGADPWAPVTVVGPSPYANLALRRELLGWRLVVCRARGTVV